jgi:heterodisulfide reductase subunit A
MFLRASIDDVSLGNGGDLSVIATNEIDPVAGSYGIEGEKLKTTIDMVVLSVGMVPAEDSQPLKEALKIPLSDDGFFLESHPKLHPLETSIDGIFLAGACQGPKDFRESLITGSGAAAKAQCILSREELLLDGLVAEIDPDKCIGCKRCFKECPFGAIELFKIEGEKEEKARVVSAACKGCGVCAGACPTGAADTLGFTEEAINSQIEMALEKNPGEKILAFCCNWCSYAGADFAGVSRLDYPSTLRIIRIMCSGRVNERFILHAFELGAGRVLVSGCHPHGDCHYISGNLRFQARFPTQH